MQIGVIGLNHKLADLKLREKIAKVGHRLFEMGLIPLEGSQYLLLSTCNRTEVYFTSHDLASTHTLILNHLKTYLTESEEHFDQKLYSFFGLDCFTHLGRVTSGLDSAIIGETEIQGQVKVAYEKKMEHSNLSYEIHYLFQKSLKLGKQVRSTFDLGRGFPDLEHAVISLGQRVLLKPEEAKVLFVGVSDINVKILNFFKSRGIHNITIANRTLENVNDIVKTHSLSILEWKSLRCWHEFDWIIFGTKAPGYLISSEELPPQQSSAVPAGKHKMDRRRSLAGLFGDECVASATDKERNETDDDLQSASLCFPAGTAEQTSLKLIIDLCVPRNVDPLIGRNPQIALFNIDQINRSLKVRKRQLNHLICDVESFIVCESKKQVEIFVDKERAKRYFYAS